MIFLSYFFPACFGSSLTVVRILDNGIYRFDALIPQPQNDHANAFFV
jgi:hypothetical protein